jgi:hypothetical protein
MKSRYLLFVLVILMFGMVVDEGVGVRNDEEIRDLIYNNNWISLQYSGDTVYTTFFLGPYRTESKWYYQYEASDINCGPSSVEMACASASQVHRESDHENFRTFLLLTDNLRKNLIGKNIDQGINLFCTTIKTEAIKDTVYKLYDGQTHYKDGDVSSCVNELTNFFKNQENSDRAASAVNGDETEEQPSQPAQSQGSQQADAGATATRTSNYDITAVGREIDQVWANFIAQFIDDKRVGKVWDPRSRNKNGIPFSNYYSGSTKVDDVSIKAAGNAKDFISYLQTQNLNNIDADSGQCARFVTLCAASKFSNPNNIGISGDAWQMLYNFLNKHHNRVVCSNPNTGCNRDNLEPGDLLFFRHKDSYKCWALGLTTTATCKRDSNHYCKSGSFNPSLDVRECFYDYKGETLEDFPIVTHVAIYAGGGTIYDKWGDETTSTLTRRLDGSTQGRIVAVVRPNYDQLVSR